MKSFGTNFVIVNDVIQALDPKIFQGGPWTHLATVVRGLKEYMAFKHAVTGRVYIEQVDNKEPGLLKRIESEAEWYDIAQFLADAKLLEVGTRRELKINASAING